MLIKKVLKVLDNSIKTQYNNSIKYNDGQF